MSSHKKLTDLRLTDLKHELEKRNLDISGNKAALQSRLEEALIAEGNNPNEFCFNGPEDADDGKHNSSETIDEASTTHDKNLVTLGALGDSAQGTSRNEEHVEVRNETGDLLVHDDEEESDLLADSGGRRNHANQDRIRSLSPTHRMDSTSGASVTAGGDSTQNTTNGDDGNEEMPKEATGEDHRRLEDENEDELNRSREYIKSNKIPKETDEEKAKSRNLWVSNLSSRVKAQDLTTMFSKFGPTDGAKVIISNRDQDSPFGFVTMATIEAADECVKQLDGTEWNGKNIKVEKIARDPTSSSSATTQNGGAGGEAKSRHHTSAARRGGGGDSSTSSTRRIAASDRRRLGAKGEITTVTSTTEEPAKATEAGGNAEGTQAAKEESEADTGIAPKEKDIEYYKRKVRRDYDIIRELEATIERNRRRQNFLIQREREKASRIENQCRNSLRRERDLLASERDMLDKRRSDLDRLEKALADRERMLKERERHLEEKERDYGSSVSRQSSSARQPTTLSASTYGPSQQSSARYYSNPPVASSSTSKRPYEGSSSSSTWENKRMTSRADYPGTSDRQSASYGQSSSSSYQRGGRGNRDYEDRGAYGANDDSNNYNRSTAGSRGRRWAGERGGAGPGGVTSSSVAHWVKPVNHRPPFVGSSSADVDSPGDSSWSRGGSGMQSGSTRRF